MRIQIEMWKQKKNLIENILLPNTVLMATMKYATSAMFSSILTAKYFGSPQPFIR